MWPFNQNGSSYQRYERNMRIDKAIMNKMTTATKEYWQIRGENIRAGKLIWMDSHRIFFASLAITCFFKKGRDSPKKPTLNMTSRESRHYDYIDTIPLWCCSIRLGKETKVPFPQGSTSSSLLALRIPQQLFIHRRSPALAGNYLFEVFSAYIQDKLIVTWTKKKPIITCASYVRVQIWHLFTSLRTNTVYRGACFIGYAAE